MTRCASLMCFSKSAVFAYLTFFWQNLKNFTEFLNLPNLKIQAWCSLAGFSQNMKVIDIVSVIIPVLHKVSVETVLKERL